MCAVAALLCTAAAVAGSPGRFEALLINGGGSPEINYRSHLLHLREMLSLLREAGVPASRISVFSADGRDPAADLAVREGSARGSSLLDGTATGAALSGRMRRENSSVEGVALRPATAQALGHWFRVAAQRLDAGDTLLIYVTDHGRRAADDLANNSITLWGDNERLTVSELGKHLAKLDPGVRVVALMSQCFSGAFGELLAAKGLPPRGDFCGYFSSTGNRPAYGCYPENFDEFRVGHSFHFIDALRREGRFAAAHARVLVDDRTPDVPLRTSDLDLERLFAREAETRGESTNRLIDEQLTEAFLTPSAWEPEIRRLDAIASAFGFFSPRSLAEIEELADRLPQAAREFERYGEAWGRSFAALNRANLAAFLAGARAWRERLSVPALKALREPARQATARELEDELASWIEAHPARAARVARLRPHVDDAAAAAYRMEVRLAAILRMRSVLTEIAGRLWLEREARPEDRAAHRALLACEDLRLPGVVHDSREPEAAEPFPSYESDLELARTLLPGWMGIRFGGFDREAREARSLPEGAVDVQIVFPETPAERAGIEAGDVVLGPPGEPFDEPFEISEWIMTGPIGTPRPLAILRGEEERVVELSTTTYPLEMPALPGLPAVGHAAPALSLEPYRGDLPRELRSGGPYLLFFWATWCAPCKAAVAEVLAFERERGVRVLAITDERAAALEPFFAARADPFPSTVAIDPQRRAFVNYGVGGTPSFVLVGGDGRVEAVAVGYERGRGLALPGWSWEGAGGR